MPKSGDATGLPNQCTSKAKSTGGRCKRRAIPGGRVCKIHGGGSPQVKAKAEERLALERLEAMAVSIMESQGLGGGELDVRPAEVMLEQVRKAAWNVAKYEYLVRQLQDEVTSEGGPVVTITEDGVAQVAPAHVGAGIAGRIDPSNWKAAPHVIVSMYNDERDRLMRYAKMCRDANVDEAMVRLAEGQGNWVVTILDRVLAAMVLTAEQQAQLPQIMDTVLAELPAGT